jgi:TFIIF-interacting CTD phosphatase-like protein
VLFTSATEEYANKVLEIIDPNNTIFSYKLYRQHCSPIGCLSLTKDLGIIANREVESIFLVDNNILNLMSQLDNGYLIPSFYDDCSDRELFELQKFLEDSVNIKENLKRKFRLSERLEVLNKLIN